MKKLFLIAVLSLLVFSCSSSDDGSSSDGSAFHPPNWIQGSWSFDQDVVNGFRFTDDDYCVINLNQENCFPNEINEVNDVEEQISESDYTITINQMVNGQVFQSNTYHFINSNDPEQIIFDDPIVGDRVMYKID